MARQSTDRDDLYAELATAQPKWELQIPGRSVPIITGFRPGKIWSLYFTPDEVYHFDAEGRLRRAFLSGVIYRSAGDTLSKLVRSETPEETALLRTDLSPTDLEQFVALLKQHLLELWQALKSGLVTIVRSEPPQAETSPLLTAIQQALSVNPPLAPALKG